MTTVADPGTSLEAHGNDPGDPGRARRVGGPGERLDAARCGSSCSRAWPARTWTASGSAWSCRTAPGPARCRCCCRPRTTRWPAGPREVTVVIALGTHQGMSEEHLARHLGYQPGGSEQVYPGWRILNHESWLPETFTTLGTIGADRLTELTGGLMTDTAVTVRINRARRRRRRRDRRRAGVPARGGRLLRRQQVLLPRRLRTGADRPVPLGRARLITSAEMIGTRGRHPGPGPDQRGRDADPRASGSPSAWWSRRAPTPCTPPRSARPRTPGPPAPRSRRRPT